MTERSRDSGRHFGRCPVRTGPVPGPIGTGLDSVTISPPTRSLITVGLLWDWRDVFRSFSQFGVLGEEETDPEPFFNQVPSSHDWWRVSRLTGTRLIRRPDPSLVRLVRWGHPGRRRCRGVTLLRTLGSDEGTEGTLWGVGGGIPQDWGAVDIRIRRTYHFTGRDTLRTTTPVPTPTARPH